MREQNLTKGDGKNYLIVTEMYFNAFKEKNLDILTALLSFTQNSRLKLT